MVASARAGIGVLERDCQGIDRLGPCLVPRSFHFAGKYGLLIVSVYFLERDAPTRAGCQTLIPKIHGKIDRNEVPTLVLMEWTHIAEKWHVRSVASLLNRKI